MRLQKFIRVAEDIVSFALLHKVEDSIAFLKKVFQPDFDPATLPERLKEMMQASPDSGAVNLDFFFQLDDYIKTKRRKVSAGMIRTYNVVKERLLAFQKCRKVKITFDSFHWVVIPLRPEAYDILINRFNKKVPKTTNEELNRHIKKVARLAGIDIPIKASYKRGNQDMVTTKPKFAWITTHTCRRSFCTNEFLAGTPAGAHYEDQRPQEPQGLL